MLKEIKTLDKFYQHDYIIFSEFFKLILFFEFHMWPWMGFFFFVYISLAC